MFDLISDLFDSAVETVKEHQVVSTLAGVAVVGAAVVYAVKSGTINSSTIEKVLDSLPTGGSNNNN